MGGNLFELVLVAFVVVAGGAVIALGVVLSMNERRRFTERERKETRVPEQAPPISSDAMQEIFAVVVDQSCQVQMIGAKTPKTVQVFTVVFEDAHRQRLIFQVPQEMYAGLDVGQRGMLTYVDNCLYGFELEET